MGFEPNGVDVAGLSGKDIRVQEVAAKFCQHHLASRKLAYYLSLGHRDEELLCPLAFTDQQTTGPQKWWGTHNELPTSTCRLDVVEKTESFATIADGNALTFHLDLS